MTLLGPLVPYFSLENGKYRRSLLLKYKKREVLEEYLRDLLKRFSSVAGVRISINVDPLDY